MKVARKIASETGRSVTVRSDDMHNQLRSIEWLMVRRACSPRRALSCGHQTTTQPAACGRRSSLLAQNATICHIRLQSS